MMFSELDDELAAPFALSIHLAALDSGCTSHAVMEIAVPEGAIVDTSRPTNIRTALNGASIHARGRSSSGILEDFLVIGGNKLAKNLVSIPKLDRMGYTITFRNGKGVVTNAQGNIITSAPLSKHDLYEFDIRQMFDTSTVAPAAMLGSVDLPDADP